MASASSQRGHPRRRASPRILPLEDGTLLAEREVRNPLKGRADGVVARDRAASSPYWSRFQTASDSSAATDGAVAAIESSTAPAWRGFIPSSTSTTTCWSLL